MYMVKRGCFANPDGDTEGNTDGHHHAHTMDPYECTDTLKYRKTEMFTTKEMRKEMRKE